MRNVVMIAVMLGLALAAPADADPAAAKKANAAGMNAYKKKDYEAAQKHFEKAIAEDPGFVTLDPGEGVSYLAVQTSAGYQPPAWPNEPGRQQMQLHLDIEVANLDEAVAAAVALGATEAAYQPQHDVRVLLDPAGHPFCLYCSGWPTPTT